MIKWREGSVNGILRVGVSKRSNGGNSGAHLYEQIFPIRKDVINNMFNCVKTTYFGVQCAHI